MREKILLHACCAICAGHPIKLLQEQGYEPIAYFFNPNIYPSAEYQKRQEAMETLCNHFDCELITDNTKCEFYDEIMVGYENYTEGSERCTRCFELRLLKTAFKAQELGINKFTTTLTSSPHKKFETVQKVGKFFESYFHIDFMDYNFKKQDGFLKTIRIADTLGLYRQNYCGCKNSMQRILKPKSTNGMTKPQ